MNTFPISLLAKDVKVNSFKIKEINTIFNQINIAAITLNIDAIVLLDAVNKRQTKINNYTIIYEI